MPNRHFRHGIIKHKARPIALQCITEPRPAGGRANASPALFVLVQAFGYFVAFVSAFALADHAFNQVDKDYGFEPGTWKKILADMVFNFTLSPTASFEAAKALKAARQARQ